ncbi:MAG: sensor histidine kinase [Anaerolineae bacterium]
MTDHDPASHPSQIKRIEDVQNQIVDAVFIITALFGMSTFFFSTLFRDWFQWQIRDYEFGIIVLIVLAGAYWRKHLPYRFKVAVMLGCTYTVGVLSLLQSGLNGSAVLWLSLTLLLTMILCKFSSGVAAYAVLVVTIVLVSLATREGFLIEGTRFDPPILTNNALVSRMIVIVLIWATLVASVGRIIVILTRQLEQYRQRSEQLTDEIKRREDTEARLAEVVDNLKDLDRLKDDFIDSVSHELRTPIANIQLYHQLLAMRGDRLESYLPTLQKETERLSYIVEQMLHASGDTYDMTLITVVDIDLNQTMRQQVAHYQDDLQQKKMTLAMQETDAVYLTLASPEHIDRAIANLIDNAVKYTPEGGIVRFEPVRDDHHEPALVGIRISNDGQCPAEGKRIFDRFVRGEAALQMGVPGAGLGLPIALHIVEQYRGRIDFDCDEQAGTVNVTLWLPLAIPMTELLATINT